MCAKSRHLQPMPWISYPFDAMMENGGYTWYRIGENEWIADKDGEYLQVEKNEG